LQLAVEVHLDDQSRLRGSFGLPNAVELKTKLLPLDHHDPRALTRLAQNFASGLHPALPETKAVVGASTQCYAFRHWMAAFLADQPPATFVSRGKTLQASTMD
jgi:hypothetical protein